MGDWSHSKSEWLDTPEQATTKWEPFHVRGERLLRTWIRVALDPDREEIRLRLGCGFQLDAETNEFMGAVIKIEFDDQDIAHFRLDELREIVAFLRKLYSEDTAMQELGKRHLKDAMGFIDALEKGIFEAQKFEAMGNPH